MQLITTPSTTVTGILLIISGLCFAAAYIVYLVSGSESGAHVDKRLRVSSQLDSQDVTALLLQRTARGGDGTGRHRLAAAG